MQVLLIRHGDPDYAHDTLTDKGHAEAKALAKHLRKTRIDDIYASPMGRAQATMSYTAKAHKLAPVTLPWLHELDGNFEGCLWAWNVPGAEVLASPELPGHDNWVQTVPYGPHMQGPHTALARNFDLLVQRYGYEREHHRYRVHGSTDKTVALFCHAGVVMSLLSQLLTWPLPLVYSHLSCDTSSVSRLVWIEHDGYAVPRAKTINDLAHLK